MYLLTSSSILVLYIIPPLTHGQWKISRSLRKICLSAAAFLFGLSSALQCLALNFQRNKTSKRTDKESDVKSGTNSKCKTLLEARAIYCEVESLFVSERTVSSPQKSTPILEKEKLSSTLKEGKSVVSDGRSALTLKRL